MWTSVTKGRILENKSANLTFLIRAHKCFCVLQHSTLTIWPAVSHLAIVLYSYNDTALALERVPTPHNKVAVIYLSQALSILVFLLKPKNLLDVRRHQCNGLFLAKPRKFACPVSLLSQPIDLGVTPDANPKENTCLGQDLRGAFCQWWPDWGALLLPAIRGATVACEDDWDRRSRERFCNLLPCEIQ
jgi:hypothetical protein